MIIMRLIPVVISVMIVLLQQEDPYKAERYHMIESQIIQRGLTHKATLDAMRKVLRHKFVPSDMEKYAYDDSPLPIGNGQTISQPYIVAYMTAAIDPKSTDKVLEIGTGSGYQAAVLAEIVDQVYSIEIIEDLYHTARERLELLGYNSIHLKLGDGYYGWEENAPYDKIIVTAAADEVPSRLISQLKNEGIMIIPVGSGYSVQYLTLIKKEGDKIKKRKVMPVRFVPFTRENE